MILPQFSVPKQYINSMFPVAISAAHTYVQLTVTNDKIMTGK